MLCLGDIQTWNYSARNIQIFCIDDGWQIQARPSKPCLDVPEILKRLNQINWNLPVLMCSHSKLQALNMEVGGTSWQVNLPFKDYVACWLFSNDTNSQILFLTIECRYSFDTLWFFFSFFPVGAELCIIKIYHQYGFAVSIWSGSPRVDKNVSWTLFKHKC